MIAERIALAEAHPHDFTLQYPPRREYFQERFRADVRASFDDARALLLYVHVPFCAHRCSYCNFAVDVSADEARMERYVAAVERELASISLRDDAVIGGIDVGGGTPTRLPPALLARLLARLRPFVARSDARFPLSIETTPEIAATSPEIIAALHEGSVSRVSVGLQSSDPALLSSVNRGVDVALHARALAALRSFPRVNIDLVFALPGQDRAQWSRDVRAAIALHPDSITTYDCLYRGKGRAMTRRSLLRPSPATYRAYYDDAYALLDAAGYRAPYGSVNFSRHPGETGTSAYFERRLLDGWPYLGVGTYATSHRDDVWTFARAGVDRWLRDPRGDAYLLPRDETMAKYLLLSLSFGVLDRARFLARFGEPLDARFGARLAYAVERGFLRADDAGYHVAAFDALPRVRALLYSDEAIAWLTRLCDRSDAARSPLASTYRAASASRTGYRGA